MSIKRYIANKDNTITDAYLSNLVQNAKDSNMGESDSLEIFSLYGQASSTSVEKSRILIQFPVDKISEDRSKSILPASGSMKFFLKMFNVEHPYSTPREFTTDIYVISQSWDEGYGLDMENYSDLGYNSGSISGYGSTWRYRLSGSMWSYEGGTYLNSSKYMLKQDFTSGLEDIDVDVTDIVEDWVSNTINNNGFMIKLSSSFEDGSKNTSFYTKKFSARGSEFFFKRPCIEARWESITNDDRGVFYASSSLLSDQDNKMNIYFYNNVRGSKKNIVGNIIPGIKFYLDSNYSQEISSSFLQVTNPLSGIYKCVVCLDTSASIVYDKWYNTGTLAPYFSSSIDIYKRENFDYDNSEEYILKILNNKYNYYNNESAKFKIFARKKDWQPTIYSVATNNAENEIITDLYYKIFRLSDNYVVVDYSTGSLAYTKTSYDSKGNYFDFDMSILEKGYNYGIKLARWNGYEINESPTTFKFKVE